MFIKVILQGFYIYKLFVAFITNMNIFFLTILFMSLIIIFPFDNFIAMLTNIIWILCLFMLCFTCLLKLRFAVNVCLHSGQFILIFYPLTSYYINKILESIETAGQIASCFGRNCIAGKNKFNAIMKKYIYNFPYIILMEIVIFMLNISKLCSFQVNQRASYTSF